MHNTLLLTADEVPLFEALPDDVKEGWIVKEVDALHEESQEEIAFRLRMAKVQDHALRSVIDSLIDAPDIAEAAKQIDYTTFPPAAFAELCFLLGVRTLTAMIRHALMQVESDEDMEGIVGLSYIRLSLSDVNIPS